MNYKYMKKLVYLVCLIITAISCSTMGKSEKAILEYMRNQTGSPQLEISFSDVRSIKHTVGDSIRILQEKYEQELKEKSEQIKLLQEGIQKAEEALKTISKDESMLYDFYTQHIKMSKQQLQQCEEKKVIDGKLRYTEQDTSKVIAIIVNCRMTLQISPVLSAKQTKEGSFLLSPDESICIRRLK